MNWWPYWLLLEKKKGRRRLSYRPIFEHFITAMYHCFQSNSRAFGGNRPLPKNSLSSQLPYPSGTRVDQPKEDFGQKSAKISKISKNQQIARTIKHPYNLPEIQVTLHRTVQNCTKTHKSGDMTL